MSTVVTEAAPSIWLARTADYVELTKPRISLLVLFTVAAGCLLGAGTALDLFVLVHTLAGTASSPRARARSTSSWSATATPACGAPRTARCPQGD